MSLGTSRVGEQDSVGAAGSSDPSAQKITYGSRYPNTIPGKIEEIDNLFIRVVAMFFYVIFNVVFPVLPFLIDFLINGTKPTPSLALGGSSPQTTPSGPDSAVGAARIISDFELIRHQLRAAERISDNVEFKLQDAYTAAHAAFWPLYKAAEDAYNAAEAAYVAAYVADPDPDSDVIAAYTAACVAFAPFHVVYRPIDCKYSVEEFSKDPESYRPGRAIFLNALRVVLSERGMLSELPHEESTWY